MTSSFPFLQRFLDIQDNFITLSVYFGITPRIVKTVQPINALEATTSWKTTSFQRKTSEITRMRNSSIYENDSFQLFGALDKFFNHSM